MLYSIHWSLEVSRSVHFLFENTDLLHPPNVCLDMGLDLMFYTLLLFFCNMMSYQNHSKGCLTLIPKSVSGFTPLSFRWEASIPQVDDGSPPWPIMICVFIWVQQPDSGVICHGPCCLSYTDLSVEMCGVCIAVRSRLTCGFWVARPLNVLSLVAEPQGCVGRVDEIAIWVMCVCAFWCLWNHIH